MFAKFTKEESRDFVNCLNQVKAEGDRTTQLWEHRTSRELYAGSLEALRENGINTDEVRSLHTIGYWDMVADEAEEFYRPRPMNYTNEE